VQHDDWGVRADRWSGIRSEMVRVRDTDVHVLRHDPSPDAPADAPVQLLVHGLGGSSTNWLEVMAPLSAHGPVVAPDLPGFGRTEPPTQSASRTGVNARFLGAFTRALGLDRVVLHGNSMGGLIGVLAAVLEPERVERLVLVDPALPAQIRSARHISKRTLARFAPFAVPPLGRAALRYAWQQGTPESLYRETADFIHGDPANLAPEIEELGIANLEWGREQPWRLHGFASAASSVVAAVTVGSRATTSAVERVEAPTLLLWGDLDRLVGRQVVENLVDRRPDWDVHVFESVGHVPMLEAPRDYVDVVSRWFAAGDDAPGIASVAEAAGS
jgi:pimeloyl-ACP methyl ester carboxylesterase